MEAEDAGPRLGSDTSSLWGLRLVMALALTPVSHMCIKQKLSAPKVPSSHQPPSNFNSQNFKVQENLCSEGPKELI